jgi:regulator of protease activity HflC (stomatin/prohibitin superfamily)
MNVGRHPTQTKDNVKLDVDASVSFRVINPIISHYVLGSNLNRALQELTISSLRDMVGQYTLDHVLAERQNIAERSREIVAKGIPPGIKVENVFVDEIIIPPQIERDLTSAARQKRLS